ncbi:hypothetical protein [Tissierella praeacuta]|uniref:hypothetical protein n=1 Tax=Tissierella praeacuta TaxID=43131 RepID=UPI002FD9A719
MKKYKNMVIIFILILSVVTLSSCKKKDPIKDLTKEPTESIENSGEDGKDREKIMEDFDSTLKNKDLDKIVSFIDENIGKLSQIEGDKMVSELENILSKSLDSMTDSILEIDTNGELIKIGGTEFFFPEDKIKDIQDENLRNLVTKLINSKYKLVNIEGNYYPLVDYEKMKEYNDYISDEMKEYIAIKAMDSNEPVAIDAGLKISYDELASRIIQTEKYIQRYSQGQRHEEMLGSYKNKLVIYLGGLDNTPICDPQSKKIYDEVLESYRKTSKTKDSTTAFIINKYIGVIEENKLIVNKVVEDKIVSLVNEALALLEVSK